MYICTILFYPFICGWTFRLLLYFGYCNKFFYEYWDACIFSIRVFCVFLFFFFLDICPEVGMFDHMVDLFLFFKEPLYTILHSGCTNLHSHNSVGGSLFSTPSPAFVIWRLLNDRYSEWYEVILHCSFDLHLSSN